MQCLTPCLLQETCHVAKVTPDILELLSYCPTDLLDGTLFILGQGKIFFSSILPLCAQLLLIVLIAQGVNDCKYST